MITRSKTIAKNKKNKQEIPLEKMILSMTKPSKVILSRDRFFTEKKLYEGKKTESLQMVKQHQFVQGEICWAKMRGFPLWPAKVSAFFYNVQ